MTCMTWQLLCVQLGWQSSEQRWRRQHGAATPTPTPSRTSLSGRDAVERRGHGKGAGLGGWWQRLANYPFTQHVGAAQGCCRLMFKTRGGGWSTAGAQFVKYVCEVKAVGAPCTVHIGSAAAQTGCRVHMPTAGSPQATCAASVRPPARAVFGAGPAQAASRESAVMQLGQGCNSGGGHGTVVRAACLVTPGLQLDGAQRHKSPMYAGLRRQGIGITWAAPAPACLHLPPSWGDAWRRDCKEVWAPKPSGARSSGQLRAAGAGIGCRRRRQQHKHGL